MIRHLTLAVVLTMASGAAACAREASEPAAPVPAPAVTATTGEDVEAIVTSLEREWVGAIVHKDAATLDRLLADDFSGTSPSAHLYTKKMAIDDLTKGTYIVDAMDLDEISVNIYGDMAIAFASQEEKSRYGGKDISGHYHYTDVWVKRDGRWQAVASHGTRYTASH